MDLLTVTPDSAAETLLLSIAVEMISDHLGLDLEEPLDGDDEALDIMARFAAEVCTAVDALTDDPRLVTAMEGIDPGYGVLDAAVLSRWLEFVDSDKITVGGRDVMDYVCFAALGLRHWRLPDPLPPTAAYCFASASRRQGITKTERDASRMRATVAAAHRWARDPKRVVMEAIRQEWIARKNADERINATRFAKDMARKHKDAVTIEAIKNAQTRWSKEYHPAS